MTDTSTSNENSIEIDMQENDDKKQFIDPSIDTSLTVNTDKSVELSPTKLQHFSGILYALLSAFLFTISMFVTKQLNVDLLDAVVPRFLFQSIILIIYMKLIKHFTLYKNKTKHEIFILFINVFFATTAYFSFFLAYRYLPLPDLTTIRYTQVIWTAIITAILYCEKPSISIILAVILTIIGVTCVAQPNFLFEKKSHLTKDKISLDYHEHLIGLFIAFYASIAFSIMVISNKYLLSKYKTKHSLTLLHFGCISFCIVFIRLFYKYYFAIDKIQSLKNDFLNWNYFFASLICLLQTVSAVLSQKAIKREHPSIYTIVQSSDILFSILLQNIFSSIKSNMLSLFGSILVLTSILIISGYKLIIEKKKTIER